MIYSKRAQFVSARKRKKFPLDNRLGQLFPLASQLTTAETRMVQLPATAAIEYVAAGHFFRRGSFGRGGLLSGGLLPGGTFVRGAYARSPPQFQYVYEPSRFSVPSMIYVYPAGGRIQLT